jgi:repressor LexA
MSQLRLPPRQAAVLEFLRTFVAEKGYAPTIRETAQAFGIASPNGVLVHFLALERKGYIRRDPQRSRALALLAT